MVINITVIKPESKIIFTKKERMILKKGLDLLVEKENDTIDYTVIYMKLI